MKKQNNFKLEDLLIFLAESYKEMVELLKDIRPALLALNDKDYRDSADAKRELNVSDSTLYRWRKEGLIRYTINKGKIYYDVSSVLRKKK